MVTNNVSVLTITLSSVLSSRYLHPTQMVASRRLESTIRSCQSLSEVLIPSRREHLHVSGAKVLRVSVLGGGNELVLTGIRNAMVRSGSKM